MEDLPAGGHDDRVACARVWRTRRHRSLAGVAACEAWGEDGAVRDEAQEDGRGGAGDLLHTVAEVAVQGHGKGEFAQGDPLIDESAQVWTFDPNRKFISRVRRMVDNELKEEKTELPQDVPKQYDFRRVPGMLPKALQIGGKWVPKQVEIRLKRNLDAGFQRLW